MLFLGKNISFTIGFIKETRKLYFREHFTIQSLSAELQSLKEKLKYNVRDALSCILKYRLKNTSHNV